MHILLLIVPVILFAANTLQDGLKAMEAGHYEEARSIFEQAIASDNENPFLWSSLASAYLHLNRRDKALGAAAKAEQFGVDNPTADHALALFYNDAAQSYAQAGERARALDLAGKAGQKDPAIAFQWSQALLREQQFTEAADLLARTLTAHPGDVQLTLALGVARYGQRRFEDAIKLFLEVTRLDPSVEQPYFFLSKMLGQAGPHLPEVRAAAENWAHAEPQKAKAQLVLAEVLLEQGIEAERARNLLARAIELDPSDWTAHYQLGISLSDRHDYRGAARELEQAIALNTRQPETHYQLARVYDRLGEREKAREEREAHARLTSAGDSPPK